jgi:DNA-binding NtrC family response regulator
VDVEDEHLAVRHHAPLLITADSTESMLAIAHRVHAAAFGAKAPFVRFRASAVSCDHRQFAQEWATLMQAARGGSVLVTDIDQLPRAAQQLCNEVLASARGSSASTARLMSGTTVSLLHRVRAGTFSEALLYRLNVIHLIARDRD